MTAVECYSRESSAKRANLIAELELLYNDDCDVLGELRKIEEHTKSKLGHLHTCVYILVCMYIFGGFATALICFRLTQP